MFHTYVIIFMALIFITPAVFHIYLERIKEDVAKVRRNLFYLFGYVCIVGLAFLVSLALFGFGFAPQDYIIEDFRIIIGVGFLIGALGAGVIMFNLFFTRSGREKILGRFLIQLITAILVTIVGAIAFILSLHIILT
jgi:hypothetical protein